MLIDNWDFIVMLVVIAW